MSSAEYSVRLDCEAECPRFVVLLEPYSPLWKSDPGTSSIAIFSFGNGFPLQPGTREFDIVYSPETGEQYGFIISLASIVTVSLVLVVQIVGPLHNWRRKIGSSHQVTARN
jgi:hypothetical protein